MSPTILFLPDYDLLAAEHLVQGVGLSLPGMTGCPSTRASGPRAQSLWIARLAKDHDGQI
jgi:hypothetical protein